MELYGAGNAILYFRRKKEFSQIQVCEGICTEMTLSRIETGVREFDSLISEVLLSRVGKTPERFEFVLNDEDYHLYDVREKIKGSLHQKDFEKAEQHLQEYEKIMPKGQPLHKQFILYYQAMLEQQKGGREDSIRALLHQAIDMTRPDYKTHPKTMMLFSNIEVRIIYQLFLYERYSEETLSSLLQFMENTYDAEQKERLMVPFLYQSMRRQEESGNWFDVEKMCTRAIQVIQAGRGFAYLTDFYFSRVKARERMRHGRSEREDIREELLEDLRTVYYMSMVEENSQRMQEAEEFCREKLLCPITTQEI